MLGLKKIKDYVSQTADILGSVRGMDIIIVDHNSYVLADTAIEQCTDEDERDDPDFLSNHAIVRTVVRTGTPVILEDIKNQNQPCRHCVNANTCRINSIIAYPIMGDDGLSIGGIGLYARTDESRIRLLQKREALLAFVSSIADLIVSKLKETEEKLELQAMQERLRLLLGSMSEAIVGLDEQNQIVNSSKKFDERFALSKTKLQSLSALCEHLHNQEFSAFIALCCKEQQYRKDSLRFRDAEFTVTFKPILVNAAYRGALLYFKEKKELYAEINKIKNNYAGVTFSQIIGTSPELMRVKKNAEHFAKSPSTIFIHGKSGTGKEMFARAIHSASLVSNGPFITVNCAAIPENLLESELFGHKEGAFTGSMKGGKVGKFEFANNGTLFLDEIGEMPLHLQAKLLRAVQERRIQPVGSNTSIPVNIRIISATNQDMEEMIANGTFREDLYYRLNVIPLEIPELKERRQDILNLMEFFLDQFNHLLDKNIEGFDAHATEVLYNYDWPGNIRELQNVVEYAVNDCSDKFISLPNLPLRAHMAKTTEKNLTFRLQPIAEIEKICIAEALRVCGKAPKGKEEAARLLGLSRSTFYRKLKEYHILDSQS